MHDETRNEINKTLGFAAAACMCLAGALDAKIRETSTAKEIEEYLQNGKLPRRMYGWMNEKAAEI